MTLGLDSVTVVVVVVVVVVIGSVIILYLLFHHTYTEIMKVLKFDLPDDVVIGVIVTPPVLGCSRLCGGSGINPLRLANISATFLRSV